MSSDSEESSQGSEPEHEHLGHIWRSIQQTKNLSEMIDRTHSSHNKHHQIPQKLKNEDCQEREYQQNLAHLLTKVRDLERENRRLRFQLQQEKGLRDRQLDEIRKDYQERLRVQLRKTKTTEKQNISHNKKDNQVDQLTRQNEKIELRLKAISFDNRNLQLEIKRLSSLNQTYLQQLSDNKPTTTPQVGRGQRLLELEEANQTVYRLVELLRRTQEYKEYAYFMQEIGDMHYLKNIIRRLKNNSLNVKPLEKKVCSCRDMKLNQKLLWSPVQCYKTMLQMKVKYDYLSEDCIEQVLFQMNRIYSSKEEKTIQKMKQNNQNQVLKLKKQIQHGYDQVLTKKQINRLKKELKVVKSAQKTKAVPKMNQLRDKGQLEDILKMKEREIKLLKERLKLFQTENGFQDKALYYEGTLNALDKVLSELDNNEASLKQFEVRFRERVQDNMEPEDWLSSYKQFFQALEELGGGLAERILGFKQSILMKMSKGE